VFSIKSLLHDYAATLNKTFEHDRANTIGASEIGACLRKTWFGKNDVPHDPDYADRYGARLRGNLIEDHYVVPGLRASLPPSARAFMLGEEQRTIVDGYISATPDGVIAGLERDCLAWLDIPDIGPSGCLAVEFKSLDPRADLRGVARSHHTFQVQVQLGLLRAHTKFKPDFGLIAYVDASFLDEITEFPVAFDPVVYAAAQQRSRDIMAATDPLEMRPEGKFSGGAECAYCPWASHCAKVVVAGIPKAEGPALGDNALAELHALRDRERGLDEQIKALVAEQGGARETIKEFLRENHIRRVNGDGWEISWSQVKGRETLDQKAMEAAGIDLAEFRKVGEPGDRLTIK
jgi:hypothetical protein